PEMHRVLQSLRSTSYASLIVEAVPSLVHVRNTGICQPAKVEDHHAILPTHKKAGSFSSDEQKLYDLIVRRFLAHFYYPAEYKVHSILTEVNQEMFKTTVKEQQSAGWKKVYDDSKKSGSKT